MGIKKTKRTPKESLMRLLPKRYRGRVRNLTEEIDLVDGCKYLVEWTADYTDGDCAGGNFPVRSIREAADFIRNSIWRIK